MVTRLMLLSVGLLAIPGAALGQEYVTKQDFSAAIEKLSNQIAALREAPSPEPSLENRVAALERGQDDIRIVQRDQGVVLGQIAMRGENGDYHWRFDTNSQSARNEFRQAIRSTIPRRGHFVIHNLSRYDKDIVVNGYQFRVYGGATLDLLVPPGTVSSWVPGEATKYWRLDLTNDHRQEINMSDRYWPVVVGTLDQVAAY